MAINYALDELLHWENENSSLNSIVTEFRLGKLSDNLLQNAAKNQISVFDEMSGLLNKIILISIYEGNRRFKSNDMCDEFMKLLDSVKDNEFESTATTLNVIVIIYLENLKYPRMVQLFTQKSSREVLLAIAFLISKNNIFDLVDKKCAEITNLTSHIANNIFLIANSVNFITLDDIANEFPDDKSFVNFLCGIFEKVDYESGVIIDSFINSNELTDLKKKSNANNKLKKKVVKTENTDSTKRFQQSNMEAISCWIESALAFHKELTDRAIMLATPKGCKDFDTERLRIGFEMVDNRMETKNDTMLTQRTNSIFNDVKAAHDCVSDKTHSNNSDKNVKSSPSLSNDVKEVSDDKCKVDSKNDNNNIVQENMDTTTSLSISLLADQVVELQNKLRAFTNSIYRKDRERSFMFSKAATQFKAYKGSTISDKLNECEGDKNDKSVHIKPSPLEYVLISDDNSFETNMALLTVIARALISEFTRYKFWKLSKQALIDAKKSSKSTDCGSSGISIGIYKKPSDIKSDIQQLKSFLTKGISPANFTNDVESKILPNGHYDVILEFLRSVNSQFTNITAQNTSKTLLHRTLFHTFIIEQLGLSNDNKTAKQTPADSNLGGKVKKHENSGKLRRAMKHNPTIELKIFNEWVIEGHLDDVPTVDDLNKLEEDIEKNAFQIKTPSTEQDAKESIEIAVLDSKCGSHPSEKGVLERVNPNSKHMQAFSMEFYSNLALVKNIAAPDPSRASKGMGEFVNSVDQAYNLTVGKLQEGQQDSELKLQNLESKLTNITNCVVL